MICGFARDHAEDLREKFNGIAQDLSLGDDAVTSIDSMDVKGCNGSPISRPYVVIRATEKTEIMRIITEMKARRIVVGVEIEVIDGFVSEDEMKA
jgi:hypothetical protein